jgi:hypothetical protein
MNRILRDKEATHHRADSTPNGSLLGKPNWLTVVLLITFLSILALPRSIAVPGLGPIVIIISAIVLVFWKFARA